MSHEELEKLQTRLDELARDGERYQPSPELETVLCARFRGYHRSRRIRQSLWIGSIAACVALLVAGGSVMVKRPPSEPAPAAVSRAPAAPIKRSPEPQREIAADAVPPVRLRAVPGRAKRRPQPRAEVAQDEGNREVMTGFIPVGLGAAFGPGERGSLVRIRLPRSTLATFGLPMNENRVADVVNADVLLGEDGLARAIRFVQ